ncbi:MAG: hydroxypyruvate isomerase family protein [Hyphomicrobiaceae bacterium]
MPRLAANLSMLFTEFDFLDRFEAAAAAGFEAVEFLFPYAYSASVIRERLDRFGLKQALFNLSPGDWDRGERGLSIFPERREAFLTSVDQALDYAMALGCPKLHVMAGVMPPALSPETARATYVENLRMAAGRAEAAGVLLLIEPLNTRDMPGYFLTDLGQARDIIEEVGSPALKLQFDVYHRQIMRGDLAVALREFWPMVGHIQIAGVPGRHEPDVGEINYPYLLDLIDELGYDGVVGCEYRPKADTVAGLAWARRYGIAPKEMSS